jgi:hypothetical protein
MIIGMPRAPAVIINYQSMLIPVHAESHLGIHTESRNSTKVIIGNIERDGLLR